MVKVKAHELRTKSDSDLLKELTELKSELAGLRVAKVSGGAASKLAKIRTVRKNVARVLTVYNQKRKEESRKAFAGKRFKPLDQRKRLTRSKRRELSRGQTVKQTLRAKTRESNFPMRKYAVKA